MNTEEFQIQLFKFKRQNDWIKIQFGIIVVLFIFLLIVSPFVKFPNCIAGPFLALGLYFQELSLFKQKKKIAVEIDKLVEEASKLGIIKIMPW